MISNSYGEANGAGLLRTLTPRRETTDITTTGNLGRDICLRTRIKQALNLESVGKTGIIGVNRSNGQRASTSRLD